MFAQGTEIGQLLIDGGFPKTKVARFELAKQFVSYADSLELIVYSDKAVTKGFLLFDDNVSIRAAYFTLKKIKNVKGGAIKPIICDFCYTLRPGTGIAVIRFDLNQQKTASLSHYVCADLACSLHVRGLTPALDYAKSQLREDVTIADRINRLILKSQSIFANNNSRLLGNES